MEVKLKWSPHDGQRHILENRKLFNTINCGRQSGKTTMGEFLLFEGVLGKQVDTAFFGPTYTETEKLWRRSIAMLQPLISHKNSQSRRLELSNGTTLQFFSLDNPEKGRGQTLGRIVVDECRMIRRLKEAWEETLMATLAKLEGDAYFLSTPNGIGTEWHQMCSEIDEDWAHFHMKTEDNPYIPIKSIERARRQLNAEIFAQEYEGLFVEVNKQKFFYDYQDKLTYSTDTFQIEDDEIIWLSFDFNVDPTTCTVYQFIEGIGAFSFMEIIRDGGTRNLCRIIKQSYLWKTNTRFWRVTGDRNGNSRHSSSNVTDYDIIQEEFGLRDDQFIRTEKRNASHVYSRTLCNDFFFNMSKDGISYFIIDKQCEKLRKDLLIAKPDSSGGLFKDRKKGFGMDACDSFRYVINARFPNGLDDILAFRNTITDE